MLSIVYSFHSKQLIAYQAYIVYSFNFTQVYILYSFYFTQVYILYSLQGIFFYIIQNFHCTPFSQYTGYSVPHLHSILFVVDTTTITYSLLCIQCTVNTVFSVTCTQIPCWLPVCFHQAQTISAPRFTFAYFCFINSLFFFFIFSIYVTHTMKGIYDILKVLS